MFRSRSRARSINRRRGAAAHIRLCRGGISCFTALPDASLYFDVDVVFG